MFHSINTQLDRGVWVSRTETTANKATTTATQDNCRFACNNSLHENMANEKDDEGSPWKGPSSVKDPKARRWMSSTAASLLDNHDQEEEEGFDEPDLLSVSVESASGSSKGSQAKKHAESNAIGQTRAESAMVSSVVRLTEGMTGMLCSASLEGAETVVAVKLGGHRRFDSETDILQKDLSTGHCGTAATFCMPPKETRGGSTKDMERTVNESLTMLDRIDTLNNPTDSILDASESTLERADTLTKTEPVKCAEFNLLDLQQLVATDILDVLGSSTGVATEWFATLGAWLLQTSKQDSQQLPRRVFRNRCSVRKAQSHRLKELWYKWHSNGSDDSSSKLGTNPSGSSDPLKRNPNMPPFRLWSLAVTKSLDDAELVAPLTAVPQSQSFNDVNGSPPIKEVKLFRSETRQSAPTPPVDLYYDSDPEIFRVARHSPAAMSNKDDYMSKKPLRWRRRITIPTPIDTTLSVDGNDVVRPLTPKHVKGKGAPSFDVTSFDSDVDERFDLLDDSLVKDFIKVSNQIDMIV
jgi:hypothetical protein